MNGFARKWKELTLALALVLGVGVFVLPRLRGKSVHVVHASRHELVQTVVTTGRVMPPAEVTISALLSASVADVRVDKGDVVKKGALLLHLDDKDAKASLAQAKAGLARARAEHRQVRNVSAPVLDESLTQSKARRDEAARRHDESQKLFLAGAISKSDLDAAGTELSLAESQYQAAQTRARAAAPGGADSATALASVQLADADVEAAEVRVERTKVLAPVDGVVISRSVEPGEVVQVGEPLLVVARTGLTQLVIEPDERNLALIAVGQSALASSEAFADRSFRARVSFIAPSVDAKRGTVEVRLEVPDPPAYLRPSMTVSVEIEVARRDNALVLEASAVRDLASDNPWVLVIRDGRAEKVEVGLGLRGDRQVEVTSGIDASTPVIAATEVGVGAGLRVRAGGG